MFFLLMAAPCFAQLTTGGLTGRILDPSQRPIEAAQVEVSGVVTRTARTDAEGLWRIAQLPPADYSLTMSKDGFAGAKVNATVSVDSIRRVDVTLPLAGLLQQVEVNAPSLQVDAADSGTVIGRDRMESLPLNRRGFLQLALLAAGVSPAVQGSQLSSRGSFAASANGGREEFNNYLLDGADNNDLYTNRYVLEPSVDTIQEFKIASGSYSAEYARSGGAQINVITRGGGNQFHGTAYEYLRNRVLDAPNYFDSGSSGKYTRNQYGGVFHGPIAANRSFFFLNGDALSERRGLTRLASVPTQAMRDGDLSAISSAIVDPFTRQPFPGKLIPASRVNRMARNVLTLFPAANRAGTAGNYLAEPVLAENFGQGGGRFDQHLAGGGLFTVRYLYSSQDLLEPYAEESTDLPGFGNIVGNKGHNLMLHYQQPLGPRLLHSLRVAANRSERFALAQNHDVDVASKWNAPWLAGIDARDKGYPFFSIQGFSPAGDATPLPLIRATTTWQLLDDISWTRGRHTWKSGFQLRNTRANGNVDLLARGSISLSGAVSGSGMSDLLLGFPSFALQAKLDNTQTLRTTSYNFYAQDDWRVTPRLSVTLGVRYEFNSPPTDPFDRMAVYDPARRTVIPLGTQGVSRSGIRADRNNFAPRAGFAYSAGARTVVRGGYGIYYDNGMLVETSSYYFNPPFFTLRAFFPTATSLVTLDNPFPASGGISPVSPSSMSQDLTTSYIQHWSLQVQRQIDGSTTFSGGYAGSAGVHLIRSRDINQARPAAGDLAPRRPVPIYGGIVFIESAANSNYHAFQASLDRRFSRRFSVLAGYTWAKSIDDTSAFLSTKPDKNFPQDSFQYRPERGTSSYDLTQRFTLSSVIALPWKIELRSILSAQGGQPFTPLLRFERSNTGNTGGNFGSDRPDVLGDPKMGGGSPERWFNTAAFGLPSRFTFGNAGRNIVRGPGFAAWDAALSRSFRLTERLRATVEAQAFNLTGRTNFDLPERYADEAASFGRIFSAKPARQAQFSLRLGF
ncbi:MAG: TonB-dependent receptor [Candidatus Solibacter usitatus]|nr:TonB-dependent receptor [Candidatus Solibacter usitatus]